MTDQTRNEQTHSTNFPIMEREGNTFVALLGFLPKEISSKTEEKDHIQKKNTRAEEQKEKEKSPKSTCLVCQVPFPLPTSRVSEQVRPNDSPVPSPFLCPSGPVPVHFPPHISLSFRSMLFAALCE
jgi:hypothetical protein